MLQDTSAPVESSAPEVTYSEEEIRSQEALVQNLGDQFASEKRKLNRMLGLDENAGMGAKRASIRSTIGPRLLETLKASPFPLNTVQLHMVLGPSAPEVKRLSGLVSEMMEDKEVLRLAGGLYVHPDNYDEKVHGAVMGKYAARGAAKKSADAAAAAASGEPEAGATDVDADAGVDEEEGAEEEAPPPPKAPAQDKAPRAKDKSSKSKDKARR